MADQVGRGARETDSRLERARQDIGSVSTRARATAQGILGPGLEGPQSAIDDEEDTAVIERALIETQRRVKALCEEYLRGH